MQFVTFRDLGRLGYAAAWEYQTAVHKELVTRKLERREEPPGSYAQEHVLLFVEHPPVYTLGKSGSAAHLLLSEEDCRARGIVGYPVLDLECFFTDVHRYVRSIEEIVVRTLADYGLTGERVPGYTGVWVSGAAPGAAGGSSDPFWQKKRKICAIGVHLSRWVTLHGFAFNVNTPLDYFEHIVPCGIADDDKTVTSLARELGHPLEPDTVKERLKRHFEAVFGCTLVASAQPA
jgi:lipoyl(octanoyl) transferase